MVFEIKDKVALITGAASGLGFEDAKELLRNGLRGVTLADVDKEKGEQAIKEIEKEFGPKKAIFVVTDVTDYKQFENAFKQTINTFKNVDILINNAGILNDAIWEREIAINVNGVVHGMLLGLDNYIPKYKSGNEGVIVNMSSIAGINDFAEIPIYCGTKHAVIGISRSFGAKVHYERTKVKVLALCPGVTDTSLLQTISGKNLGPVYETILQEDVASLPVQPPTAVSRAMAKIIKEGKTGTIWIVESDKDPYEFMIPPREQFAPS